MMQTVYDAEGKAHTVEPVDAREYLASGHYFEEAPAAAPVKGKPGRKPRDAAEPESAEG